MKDTRDRREYHKALRAKPGYLAQQREKWLLKMQNPIFADKQRERERIRSVKRRAANREKMNKLARLRHAARMEADPDYRAAKAKHSLRWIKANPAKALANVVLRDARKIQATPDWADLEHIQTFYDVANAYKVAFGIAYEVDHIVPLRSPLVCGLHVSTNLQLLEPLSNRSKGNRWWPDHPNG